MAVAGGGSAIADGVARAAKLITGSQIKNGSVTSADVKNGSLLRADFKASERARLVGPEGHGGPTGSAGPQGLPGAAGAPGADGRPRAAGHGARLRARDATAGAQPRQEHRGRRASRRRRLLRRGSTASIDASTAVAVVTANLRAVTTGAVFAIDPLGEGCAACPELDRRHHDPAGAARPGRRRRRARRSRADQGFFILVG